MTDLAIAYLDDILIKSESKEQHVKHIKEGFEKTKQYDLKFSLDTCDLFKSKIRFLGQIIDAKGRKPEPSRSSAIKNMPTPTNMSALQVFLGPANYYDNFIPNMHVLRAPGNRLVKTNSK